VVTTTGRSKTGNSDESVGNKENKRGKKAIILGRSNQEIIMRE